MVLLRSGYNAFLLLLLLQAGYRPFRGPTVPPPPPRADRSGDNAFLLLLLLLLQDVIQKLRRQLFWKMWARLPSKSNACVLLKTRSLRHTRELGSSNSSCRTRWHNRPANRTPQAARACGSRPGTLAHGTSHRWSWALKVEKGGGATQSLPLLMRGRAFAKGARHTTRQTSKQTSARLFRRDTRTPREARPQPPGSFPRPQPPGSFPPEASRILSPSLDG